MAFLWNAAMSMCDPGLAQNQISQIGAFGWQPLSSSNSIKTGAVWTSD